MIGIKRTSWILMITLMVVFQAKAQYWNGQDSLFGNEWINMELDYIKIPVAKDGIYRISQAFLAANDVPANVTGGSLQLWKLGEQVPIYVSTDANFTSQDFIIFYGQKNRGEFDTHLYINGLADQANPEYSIITDTAAYFLTWTNQGTHERILSVSPRSNNSPPEKFFIDELQKVYSNSALKNCLDISCYQINSLYDRGQGWANTSGISVFNDVISPAHYVKTGPEAELTVRTLVTSNRSSRGGEVIVAVNDEVVIQRPRTVEDFPYLRDLSTQLFQDLVTPTMEISVTGGNNPTDRYAVSVVTLAYPKAFQFDNQDYYELTIEASPIPKNITIEGFSANILGVFDLGAQEYIQIPNNGDGTFTLGLEALDKDRRIILFNHDNIQNINSGEKVNFIDYNQFDPEFIILSHPDLMKGPNGSNYVQDYADYRSSVEGGDYTTAIIDIEDLYDQFSYGINFHPSSVRHFVQWFSKNWQNPKFLFIIGKGVENQMIRKSGPNDFFFVPTFGRPGADVLLVSDVKYNPIIPTGRVPVIQPEEIKTYLEKIKSHEQQINNPQTIEDRFWTKRGIHLSGGDLSKPIEISSLRSGLDRLGTILEEGQLGLDITTFQKRTTGTVTVSDNEELTRMVNDGVSLITYFGHSFINLLDFQIIDDVNTLKEKERFSVYMGMGCYAGQIHDSNLRSYSETWTLAPRRGSIAFIANSSAGFPASLEIMGSRIFNNYGDKYFGQPIGLSVYDAIGSVINDNRNTGDTVAFTRDTELAFSLNICGDPAIRLNIAEHPDFIIDPNSVKLEEDVVSVETEKLHLTFDLLNLGRSVKDSVQLRIEQTVATGEKILLIEKPIPAPKNISSLTVEVPGLKEKSVGFNKINITIDATNVVDELPAPIAENNNDLAHNGREFCFFVTSEDARPIFPQDFGIVAQPGVTLTASTANGNAASAKYIFQIDTTELFDSPLLQSNTVEKEGGVIQWTPNLAMQNEMVYYWRISPDSTGKGSYSWRNASFVYLNQHPKGWNQSHHYQYLYDDFDSLKINPNSRNWEFANQFPNLKIKNVNENLSKFLRPAILKAGRVDWDYRDHYRQTVATGVWVTVYDPISANPLENPSPGLYGSINNSGANVRFFAFDTKEYESRVSLMNFIENEIEEGHLVIFMTMQNPNEGYGADLWASDADSTVNNTIFDVMEAKGATTIRNLAGNERPYIFAYREDTPDFLLREFTGNLTDNLEINVSIPGFWIEGRLRSTRIGPASEWKEFLWSRSDYNPLTENMIAGIRGIDTQGNKDTLISNIQDDQADLTSIDANKYPYLELDFYARDSINRSLPQLDYWRVTYESLPELAVNIDDDLYFYADTIQQGQDLELRWSFLNIGRYPTDSVDVRYNIVDAKNQVVSSFVKTKESQPGDKFNLEFKRNTLDMSGPYQLIVDVNPNQRQAELWDWNNSLIFDFYVEGDERNPLLDVTFDGIHILDGDLVSAQPEILIRLTDENQFLLLDDTSLFELEIKYPNESNFRPLSKSDPDVVFNPASSGKNEATISVNRKFPIDGIYTLKVNASDKSGNASGDISYQIRFEIVNESSISEIVNYPNPFTTSTQFVYTLTGESSPSFFKIQILTVSGKVVREITSAELGELRIGKHMTDYRYDGTDEYGEPLANGVYLYRVVARDANGDLMKKRDVGIGSFFKKGWGKMVILR